MTLIATAVLWAGYTGLWWGWLAVTDHVPDGPPDTVHWPSIRDLIIPGRIAFAIPGRNVNAAQNVGGPTVTIPASNVPLPSGTVGGQGTGNILKNVR